MTSSVFAMENGTNELAELEGGFCEKEELSSYWNVQRCDQQCLSKFVYDFDFV